jgi:hypothetical protein
MASIDSGFITFTENSGDYNEIQTLHKTTGLRKTV